MITNSPSNRKEKFFSQLKLSKTTKANYRAAINSTFLTTYLKGEYGTTDLFDITDLSVLWDIYSYINLHPKNIGNHRAYSAAIMKYIRFLNNGEKYGKRIDYNIKKTPKYGKQ